jgi:hypothetical protein
LLYCNPVKGDYAVIFEEEYKWLAKHPDYETLFKEGTFPERRKKCMRDILQLIKDVFDRL